jgi:hypothetical protein
MSSETKTGQSSTIDAPAPSTSDTASSWGATGAAPAAGWSRRKTITAVAIAAGVAGIGGAVIWASSGSAAVSTAQGFGGGTAGGPGGGASSGGLPNALHGLYVASDGNGGYETDLMQVGKVTAISPTSLTALSTDGYSHVYTLDAATALGTGGTSSVTAGDTVTVVAKTSGETATAKTVTESAGADQPAL